MTTLRRAFWIVRRSFHRRQSSASHSRAARKAIQSLPHLRHSHKSSVSASFHPSSSRLLHHHYHAYSSNANQSTSTLSSISREPKPFSSSSSFRRRLLFVATLTTLSYIGYKYFFHSKSKADETVQEANTVSSPLLSAVALTSQKLVENAVIHYNLAFRIALFFDNQQQYDRALYFYKLYLRKPNGKQGEYAALNNLLVIYYKTNQYANALIVCELLGKTQLRERNLEFLCAHCHHLLKHHDQALKYYHQFLNNHRSKQTDLKAAYNNMALLYYELGRYDKALEFFYRMGDDAIKEKNYGFRVAHSLQNLNQFESSLKYYNLYLSNPDTTAINLQNTYHNLGVLLYDNGRDKEAMQVLQKLSDAEIANRNLEFKMAHLSAKLGDKEQAIKYLKQCKKKPQVYHEYALVCQGIMAQLMYELEEYERGKQEFDELGEARIIKQDLYFPAAFCYFQCGEYETALKYYWLLLGKKQLSLTADEVDYVYTRIGLIYYRQKEYAKTVDVLQKLKEENLIKWNMEFVLAHSYHKAGKYQEALQFYDKFLQNAKSQKDDVVNCYQNLALLHYDLNQYTQCIEYFNLLNEDKIIERKLEFYVAHSYQEIGGHHDAAIKYYKLYLQNVQLRKEKEINVSHAYHNLGVVYYESERWQDAIETFLKLGEDDLVRFHLYAKLSKCYAMVGDTENEEKYAKLAESTQQKSKDVDLINIAKMYYNAYQNELALEVFIEIGDEAISKHQVEFIVAHCYQLIGDNKNAVKYYQLGLENEANLTDDSNVQSAYHNMGCAYHDDGDYHRAIECFQKLTDEHIRRTNIEFIIGVSHHNVQRTEEALKWYQLFLENPESKGSDTVMSCYNNMIVIYYYVLNDYENAWKYLHAMGDEKIIQRSLEFETAHCAQKLNQPEESLKYYRLFLKNNADKLSEEVIGNVYRNVSIMYGDDEAFEGIKKKGNGNKGKELQLFVEWMDDDVDAKDIK